MSDTYLISGLAATGECDQPAVEGAQARPSRTRLAAAGLRRMQAASRRAAKKLKLDARPKADLLALRDHAALHEDEDAAMTGLTRSLSRRLLGLNLRPGPQRALAVSADRSAA